MRLRNPGKNPARTFPAPVRSSASMAILMGAGLLTHAVALAQSGPRVPGNAVPVQARDWLQRGTGASYAVSGNTAKVTLSGPATVLHWSSMDVGAAASLRFDMASTSARVLNKVDGGAWQNMTTIEGALRSNGQVYIYNSNGILFGKGAQVNVNSLVASSLRLDEQRFMDGILSPSASPVFAADAQLGRVPGAVVVEADSRGGVLQRAAITAQDNGLILLAAPQVTNAGQLTAPDGQVVMAAGSKVYLAAPQDSTMRGLRVEVGSEGLSALAGGPAATNTAAGQIAVQRGNISMVGLAVNQMGMASATTSVNLNGSIFLRAQDGASKQGAVAAATASHGGSLVLGPSSSTTVLPTLGDSATAPSPPAGQAFKPSLVDLAGQSILVQTDARVVAPSGNVTITARANPGAADVVPNASRIEFGPGSVVDVAGSTGTQLAMESNLVRAELRGSELADNVLLRNSAVRGATVQIDRRKAQGGIAVANILGYLNLVEQNVGEATATGGKVQVVAEGAIVQQPGSRIDVSGGWVDYRSGHVAASKLTLGGRLYDIETAAANLPYDGVVTPAASAMNFETGYREGRSAGTVQFVAPAIALQGELQGQVHTGIRQRDQAAASRPLGGRLLIGNTDTAMDPQSGRTSFSALDQFGFGGKLVLGGQGGAAGDLTLDVASLSAAGFSRIHAVTSGDVLVASDLEMPAGGQLRLGAGGSLAWNGGVRMPGGSVTASANFGQAIQEGAVFDLAGRWHNDMAQAQPGRDANGSPNGLLATVGGNLRMYANQLEIGPDVRMDVSGGAWLNAAGTLAAGDAGSITLQATSQQRSLDADLRLGARLRLDGYGLSRGAALNLAGRNVAIGSDPSQGDLQLPDSFWGAGGFSSFNITANGNLTVQDNALVQPLAASWVLRPDARSVRSGAMGSVADTAVLPLAGPTGQRQAASLTLRATGRSVPGDGLGVLRVGEGAAIRVDPGASVTLAADRQVLIHGSVEAPAGTISALLLPGAPESSDNSYDSSRSIWLGGHASLRATGSAERVAVNAAGIASGEVLDGGTIRMGRLGSAGLESALGSIIAEPGSLMDVSGTSLAGLQLRSGGSVTPPANIGSSAGTIDLRAREGLLLAGTMRGQAGSAPARGGSLSVALDREDRAGGPAFPQVPRDLVISAAEAGTLLPQGLRSGQPIEGLEGQGRVGLAGFAAGGFSNLRFKSQDVLTLEGANGAAGGALALSAGSSIELNAPNLRAAAPATAAFITAPYVSLGNSDTRYQQAAAVRDGGARLDVSATTIDLTGNFATQDFGRVEMAAREDIRLVGSALQDGIGAPGSLATGHHLVLSSAQTYPTTLSSFSIDLQGADSRLEFLGNGRVAGPALSAAGSLSARAEHVVQDGRLVAPFGSIALAAGTDLVYGPNSLTSVAGQGIVPFGAVVNGADWTYDLGGQTVVWKAGGTLSEALGERRLPGKRIASDAPSVVQSAGAVMDLSGGGSLYAYEFTPGPGGSGDVLQSSGGARNQTFAINPAFRAAVAPLDWQYGSDGLKPGDQVYLSAGGGLAAGFYTLLPAHYALLPGGFAIEPASGTRDMSARENRVNADGSLTLAGYRSSSTDQRGDTRMSGFTVSPQALVRRRSEFKDFQADDFFPAQAGRTGVPVPPLPSDGGHVVFEAQSQLVLEGSTRLAGAASTGPSPAGRRGMADIAAPRLQVLGQRGGGDASLVNLSADDLVALGADSLLLGGTRTADGRISVEADSLRIDNGFAHPLTGSELILAARDTVQLSGRASVLAQAPKDAPAQDLEILGAGAAADGALLRASGGAAAQVRRADAPGRQGRLEIAAGAQVQASASMYLDATQSMYLQDGLTLRQGSALAIHAPQIALGSAAPARSDGVTFGAAGLAALSGLASLELSSYGSIDAWGVVDLGRTDMQSLSLRAATLRSHGADVKLASRTLQLGGTVSAGAAPLQQAADTGRLRARADTIELGEGSLHLQGFGSTSLVASGEILATGQAGALVVDNALTLTASRLRTGAGASGSFQAGSLLDMRAGAAGGSALPAGLGGHLSFQGGSVRSSAAIVLPAGQIDIASSAGVDIDGGLLDVRGVEVGFGTAKAHAPAGRIALDGGAGAVRVGPNALLDLSAQGASAGSLSVRAVAPATGQIALEGQLRGAASGGTDLGAASLAGGSFSIDVGSAPDAAAFAALNARLDAAGFNEERMVRVRDGDLSLTSGAQARARRIDWSADNGNLLVAGTLDARAAAGGSIELHAAQSDAAGSRGRITLAGTARLLASATELAGSGAGSAGDGGRVVLGSANADGAMAARTDGGASLLAQAGASIDVSGAGAGQDGTVVLRVPRVGTGAGSDVALAGFGATVTGSRATTIEGVKAYTASTISERADSLTNLDASLGGRMATDAAGFMGNAQSVLSRLRRGDLQVTPGVEVRSAGDLTVSVNEGALDPSQRGWNLNSWRFADQAGTLSLRAAGDLVVRGAVSDGFVAGAGALPTWRLDTSAKSWGLRLAGGADLQAAQPLATSRAGRGDVRLEFARPAVVDDVPVALLRTGTGRIDVQAARDVVLGSVLLPDPDGDRAFDKTFGAALYTAGHAVDLPAGFAAPSNAGNPLYGDGAASPAAFGALGGGVSITAGRDVVGPVVPDLVNNWLFRQGRSGVDANGELRFERVVQTDNSTSTLASAWWARPDYLSQGVATLGGGDIRVVAQGGSVRDLSVSAATSAYLPAASPAGAALQELGGGDVQVVAGADIAGGSFYVQKGRATLHASGSVRAGQASALDLIASANSDDSVFTPLRPVLALGDGRIDVSAGRDLAIETVYNPTLTRQSVHNVQPTGLDLGSAFLDFGNTATSALNYKRSYSQLSGFSTYGADSAVQLTAVGGNLLLSNNALLAAAGGGDAQPLSDYGRNLAQLFGYYPPSLQAAALTGSLVSAQGFALAPSSQGQLNLLAGQSLTLAGNGTLYPGVVMLDSDPAAMSRPQAPTLLRQPDLAVMRAGSTGLSAHTASGLHAADAAPVRVVAAGGDITGQPDAVASLNLPKRAEIIAARDIRDLGFAVQNNLPADETLVQAGRDFIDSTNFARSSPVKHVVSGPGLLTLEAGRDIDLGNGQGVVTRGNLDNAYLPAGGASVVANAGVQAAPPPARPNPFSALAGNEAFFRDLIDAARLDSLVQFDKLIAERFDIAPDRGGDIRVFGSQFKTEQGGSLDLLAPAGSVVAGLVSVPAYLLGRPASETGIFTVRGGAIRSLVQDDFVVNQGRVFTLGGGDITLVSQFGNIDAGRGAKTASSAPPPLLTTDANGNTKIDIAGSIAGSGIATLRTSDTQASGNVVALAPRGIFDAGDAGVRSTGTVAIQAAVVLNASNISAAGGVSASVAVAAPSAAPAAASASAGSSAQDAVKQTTLAPKETLALSVEVLGYGDQEPADGPDSEEERRKRARAKKL